LLGAATTIHGLWQKGKIGLYHSLATIKWLAA
jgi:hypothetical protein